MVAGVNFGERGRFGAASGHETDKINRHTPKGVVRLARGRNPGGGGADMIYLERGDGGRVFAAGSITFSGALAEDPVADRITRNVLDRFVADPQRAGRSGSLDEGGGLRPFSLVSTHGGSGPDR